MNCIVIDDEKKARELIEVYIKEVNHLILIESFRSPFEALDFINSGKDKIDLIFLDINMPGLNGVQFIKSLNQKFNIIFTTAYEEYALDGYENDVIDYLLKPIKFERFLKAIYKITNNSPKDSSYLSIENNNKSDFVMIKSGHDYHKIYLETITYLKKDSNYIEIYSTNSRMILLRENMNSIFKHFPESNFIRIHKSYVVSKSKIKLIQTKNVILEGGENIPIGISYKEALLQEFSFL